MPIKFGDLSSDQSVSIDNGMYDAAIKSMSVVMEQGSPKKNDSGKSLVDVFFEINPDNVIKRRYPIGFGQNRANSQWAAFAKLIEATTGIKCGDPAQRDVTDDQLVGRRVRIVIEQNDRGYSDVTNVLAVPKTTNGAAKAKPVPVDAGDAQPAEQLEEIPF